MINLSMESSSAVETSKESLFSKRSRGKLRLPPLSTRQLTRHILQQEPSMQTERERMPLLSCSPKLSSPLITETLITPNDVLHKCPRSPSNLSLQFNFEEPRYEETAGPFDQRINQLRSKHGHNRVKRSISKTPRNARNNKPKGYHVLNNEEPIELVEKQTGLKESRSNTITAASTVTPKATLRNDRTATPRSPGAKPSTETGLRLEATADTKERKRSTYDLHEFLSMPADTEHKINSMTAPNSNGKRNQIQHCDEKPVNLSPHCSKVKSSDDSTYDVFEFLALSAESSRHLTGVGRRKLKELRPQKSSKDKSTRKPEIPSVIVADWSLNSDFSRTKRLIRPTRELPKANFPSDDFPRKSPQHRLTLETTPKQQRKSVYDLKEFLTLPDVARIHSAQKVKPGDAKPRSNSLEESSTKEPDVKYDLGEFLTFLESGGGSSQANTASRERAMGELTDFELRNRNLSVYDIYEFLKDTNAKEMSAGVEGVSDSTNPIIDVTTLIAKSSPNNGRSVLQDTLSVTNEGKANSHGSCYDLREFLTLPANTVENNQNESQTKRSAAERLKIN